jgi:hypothetical protein
MRSKRISLNANVFSMCFIVVVCAVLVVEMAATRPFHSGVYLPKAYAPTSMWGAMRNDALTVSIIRGDIVFFSNDKVTPDALPGKI